MNVRLVCAFASSSCIGTEPAAYVEENVESENTDFRAVLPCTIPKPISCFGAAPVFLFLLYLLCVCLCVLRCMFVV